MTTVHAEDIEQNPSGQEGGASDEAPSVSPDEMSHEQLLEAYKAELEKKSASASSEDDPTEEEGNEGEEEDPSSKFFTDTKSDEDAAYEMEVYGEGLAGVFKDIGMNAKAVDAHYKETGEFPKEAYEALGKAGYAQPVVDAYLKGSSEKAAEVQDTADKEIADIKNSVGGDEAYSALMLWANENLTEAELAEFDAVLDTNSTAAARVAVRELNAKFKKAEGDEPPLVGGTGKGRGSSKYQSLAEMTKDVRDPRYGKDMTYTNAVRAKVRRSDVVSTR